MQSKDFVVLKIQRTIQYGWISRNINIELFSDMAKNLIVNYEFLNF
jgi:hypothetical protein